MQKVITKLNRAISQDILGVCIATLAFLLPYERIPSFPVALLGSTITIRPNQIAGALLIGLVIARNQKSFKVAMKLPYILMAAFLVASTMSASQAQNPKRAALVIIFTIFTMLIGSGISLSLSDRRLEWVERALMVTTIVVIGFGAYQYFGDVIGLSPSLTGLAPNYVKAVFGFPRIQSTGLEPLYFANFLLIPFFVASARYLTEGYKRNIWWLMLTCSVILVMTVSRGAIIGGVIGTGVLLATLAAKRTLDIHRLGKYIYTIAAGVLIAILLTVMPSLITQNKKDSLGVNKAERLVRQTTNLKAQDDRQVNIALAIKAFKASPILGIGPGNFDRFARENEPKYKKTDNQSIIVNNQFFELLAETGILGTISFGLFYLTLLFGLVKVIFSNSMIRSTSNIYGRWSIALLSYLVATTVQYQTFSTLYIMHIWFAIGVSFYIINQSKVKVIK